MIWGEAKSVWTYNELTMIEQLIVGWFSVFLLSVPMRNAHLEDFVWWFIVVNETRFKYDFLQEEDAIRDFVFQEQYFAWPWNIAYCYWTSLDVFYGAVHKSNVPSEQTNGSCNESISWLLPSPEAVIRTIATRLTTSLNLWPPTKRTCHFR